MTPNELPSLKTRGFCFRTTLKISLVSIKKKKKKKKKKNIVVKANDFYDNNPLPEKLFHMHFY